MGCIGQQNSLSIYLENITVPEKNDQKPKSHNKT